MQYLCCLSMFSIPNGGGGGGGGGGAAAVGDRSEAAGVREPSLCERFRFSDCFRDRLLLLSA